LALE
jgi:hypothetical protein